MLMADPSFAHNFCNIFVMFVKNRQPFCIVLDAAFNTKMIYINVAIGDLNDLTFPKSNMDLFNKVCQSFTITKENSIIKEHNKAWNSMNVYNFLLIIY
jgi:hypothetical protein